MSADGEPLEHLKSLLIPDNTEEKMHARTQFAFLTETHLNASYPDGELHIGGYNILRQDRDPAVSEPQE